jgi:thiol:disulfide interchange protein
MNMTRTGMLAVCAVLLLPNPILLAQFFTDSEAPFNLVPEGYTELASLDEQYTAAKVLPAQRGVQKGLGIFFTGTDDLHYYAHAQAAPSPEFELRVNAQSPDAEFDKAILPQWTQFHDPLQEKDIDVYVGNFTVFVPLKDPDVNETLSVKVTVSGLTCTSSTCLPPFTRDLTVEFNPKTTSWTVLPMTKAAALPTSSPDTSPGQVVSAASSAQAYSMGVYLLLAILAGLSINIMPCVLPIIPIILMRLIEQSKQSPGKRLGQGIAFCGGIILFFAGFALVATLINVTTGAVLDLNSLFRYPAVAITLFLAIVLFALVMLDIIPLMLPSAVANRQSGGTGFSASLGTGFFAAVLSIPCSGALLGFVLVWAQTQPRLVSNTAICLMGVGMALPYAVIMAIPSLLNRVPKPGTWMEIFKKSCGFLLFFVAVKLSLAALPKERLINVLLYGVIFSFCVWMWGQWVNFSTPSRQKLGVRGVGLGIALVAGYWLLPAHELPEELQIDWQKYDAAAVVEASSRNQPVLLKFTADWCTNCKVVERNVYQSQEIVDLIHKKNILAIKADTTTNKLPATRDFKSLYGEAGNVPVTIVLIPGQEAHKLRGIFKQTTLSDLLDALPDQE